jgi:hypothetical protein
MSRTKFYSDYLFARPSFLSGIARVLDLGSTLNTYNTSETPEAADELALSLDWLAIGADIENSMQKYKLTSNANRQRSSDQNISR